MSDPQTQIDFQQHHARRISAQELEVLGKQASARWAAGTDKTIGASVVETVKHAGLSPEQVRRVVEFANTDAFLETFHKLAGHRYVDFGQGVLADPRDVIRELNDGGGGSVFDRGTADYDQPPTEKISADPAAELALLAAFRGTGEATVEQPSSSWVWDVRDKLAGQAEHLSAELSGLELLYLDRAGDLADQVKQAAMDGVSLGQIVQAWSTVADDPVFIKAAFAFVTPKLLRDGVYSSTDQLERSIEKTGSAHIVNTEHPLVQGFHGYCEVLTKLAETRQAKERAVDKFAQVNYAIKRFGNDLDKMASAVRTTINGFGVLGRRAIGGTAGELIGKAVPIVGGAAIAKGLYDTASTNPHVVSVNARVNPVSRAHKEYIQGRQQQAYQNLMGY